MLGSRRGVTPMLAVALLAGSSTGTTAQSEQGSPAPCVAEIVHGWIGARGGPAGLYSWKVPPTNDWQGNNWMHGGGVDLTFYAGPLDGDPPLSSAVGGSWWKDAPFDRPTMVENEVRRREIWLLDVEGTRVAIILDSFPDTDPARLEEARAVIESIVVEPTTDGGHRLVFRLLGGWDSG